MKFSVLILPGTSCIEVVIYVFNRLMGHKIARLLYIDNDLPALDYTVNSLNI